MTKDAGAPYPPDDLTDWPRIKSVLTIHGPAGPRSITSRRGRFEPGSTLGDLLASLAQHTMSEPLLAGDEVSIVLRKSDPPDEQAEEEPVDEEELPPDCVGCKFADLDVEEAPCCDCRRILTLRLEEATDCFAAEDVVEPELGDAPEPERRRAAVAVIFLPGPPAGEG